MAARLLTSSPNIPHRFGYAKTSQAYTQGVLLFRDTVNAVLIPADGINDTTFTIEGIAVKTATAASSGNPQIEYIPILGTSVQLFVVDTTNATNVNQIHLNHLMSNSQKVNNTSTSNATPQGHFVAVGLGPTTTQLIGYFAKQAGKSA